MNFLKERLEEKKKQLNHRKDVFKVMVETEIDTANFERNAISDLCLMIELKSEIEELEHILLVLEVRK